MTDGPPLPELTDRDIDFGALSQPMPEAVHEMLHPGEVPTHTSALSIYAALTSWRNAVVREEHIPRLKTGIPTIDRATRGFQPGELFTILARTGSGKTMLTSSIVDAMLTQRPGSAFLVANLEMPCAQLVGRMLRMHFRRAEEWLELAARQDTLDVEAFTRHNQNLYFVDRGSVSLQQVAQSAADIRRQISPAPLDAIVIDHAGLVKAGRGASAYERASATAIEAKQLARQLGLLVILIVQSNRAGKQDIDPVPLESARDSGAFEENSDFVLSLGQIVTSVDKSTRCTVKGRLAKNRRGPNVPVALTFDTTSLRMAELEESRG